MRKKPRFKHVRANLHGDVSRKRFSTHAVERNVAGVAQELLSDGTGCTVTWVRSRYTATEYRHRVLSQATHHRVTTQGTATGHCHRIPSQGTTMGYCHGVPSRDTATNLCHG